MENTKVAQLAKDHLFPAILAATFFVIDLNISLGVAAGVLYVIVILVALTLPNRSVPLIWAVICTLLTLAGYYLSPLEGDLWKATSNRGISICAIWAVAMVSLEVVKKIQRDSEQKMLEFHSTFGQAAEYTSDAIVVTDEKGLVLWVNKGFTTISGYELDEVIGKKPGDLLQGKGTNLSDIKRLSDAVKKRSANRN